MTEMAKQETSTMQLRPAMDGKASDAKTADGDAPVFAYIASLPQPQRGIAEQIDALAARTLPGLRRAVKWGMAYYGVEGGWCFASGCLRRPREAHVHPRHGARASAAGHADRHGQADAGCRAGISQ